MTLVGQRVFGIALGYEHPHVWPRRRCATHPMLAVLSRKLAGAARSLRRRWPASRRCNRLELSRLEPTRITADQSQSDGTTSALFARTCSCEAQSEQQNELHP